MELVAASNESTGLLKIREGLEKETHEGRENPSLKNHDGGIGERDKRALGMKPMFAVKA